MRVWVPPDGATVQEVEREDGEGHWVDPFVRIWSWWEPDERLPFPCVEPDSGGGAYCEHMGCATCQDYCRRIDPPYEVGEVLEVKVDPFPRGGGVGEFPGAGREVIEAAEAARRWIEILTAEPLADYFVSWGIDGDETTMRRPGWAVTAKEVERG